MSLLIPGNLSRSPGEKQKRDKTLGCVMFGCDYPASAEEVEEAQAAMLALVNQPQPEQNEPEANAESVLPGDEALRKFSAVPVNPVDPLELLEPDEYGAELGKEARVWKVYVKEADKWDAELVDGWNKSLDVILVFAALFSAISTAFLIESSNSLREDPNDVSAATLLVISQTLLAIANSSSTNPLVLMPSGPNVTSSFVASQHAVIINTLWYLSLSLSVATSLLAMLAKEWCHSFTANRTGHPWDQALRRQRKWIMIEYWKMQELMAVLPSLIHLSLLLFATGLCVYVWDMNITAAIPIICITGILFGFYLWSSVMASLEKLFPYSTVISRAFHAQSELINLQRKKIHEHSKRFLEWVLRRFPIVTGCLLLILLCPIALILAVMCCPLLAPDLLRLILPQPSRASITRGYFIRFFEILIDPFVDALWKPFKLVKDACGTAFRYLNSPHQHQWRKIEGDHALMTSLALKWLVQNCETPNSVTIALQAIAGAGPRIPREHLESCHAALHILQRLASGSGSRRVGSEDDLYIRALQVLDSHAQPDEGSQESGSTRNAEMLIWDLQAEHERQIVDLIKHSKFIPTEDNLKALTFGNKFTSLGLRLLKGNGNSDFVTQSFNPIINLLLEQTESTTSNLSPIASQSLSNTAILLSSCSAGDLIPPDIARKCMDNCRQNMFRSATNKIHGALDPYTAFLVCVLLHRRPSRQETRVQPGFHEIVGLRVNCAVRVLKDERLWTPSTRSSFNRVAFYEILFHQDKYGQDTWFGDYSDWLRRRSEDYLYDASLIIEIASEPLEGSGSKIAFLTAITQVYELSGASNASNAIVADLPVPVYCTLIWITCLSRLENEQALCQEHLSRFPFLKMADLLALAAEQILPQLWTSYRQVETESETPARSWRRTTTQPQKDEGSAMRMGRLRHFAATQLWLLLYLVGDSSSEQQIELKDTIERQTGLEIAREGVYQVKWRLGTEIIQSYERGHRLGNYSTRVIGCILEDRGKQNYETLSRRIEGDLRDTVPGLRGISSFAHHLPTFERALNTELPASSISSRCLSHPSEIGEPSGINHVTIPVERGDIIAGQF